MYITEPSRKIRVSYEADLFVAGGSCTGVFAAVRAARLGLTVVLAERQNCLGGTATAGLVNVWHSLKDTDYKNQVIGGLTAEMTERLVKQGAAELKDDPSVAIRFNPLSLIYELDKLVSEEKITVVFHTLCVGAVCDGNTITHALIENKDGRTAVKAKFFIDATGDGDMARYLVLESYRHEVIQPPTPVFLMRGTGDNSESADIWRLIKEHGAEYGFDDDFGWSGPVPGMDDISMRADFHIFNVLCDKADDLSRAETDGRRKAVSLVDMINKYTDKKVSVASFSAMLGIRETLHYKTKITASGKELLYGTRYDDAILNGTYRIDVHGLDGSIILKYLNGDAVRMVGVERKTTTWNWREEEDLSGEGAKYYQIPFGVLVQEKYTNLIAAGRMINADNEAFGALRVMVNLNQIGEAAGVAAAISVDKGVSLQDVDGKDVRKVLQKGGAVL